MHTLLTTRHTSVQEEIAIASDERSRVDLFAAGNVVGAVRGRRFAVPERTTIGVNRAVERAVRPPEVKHKRRIGTAAVVGGLALLQGTRRGQRE